ncbi:MAG: TlpA family protein disulfide reductase [Gaiellaceae bacterium]
MRILPIVMLAALVVAGCGGNESSAPASSAATATTAAGGAERETATPAGNGPDISGVGLKGEALSVADFRGKPVFVNVWSSW